MKLFKLLGISGFIMAIIFLAGASQEPGSCLPPEPVQPACHDSSYEEVTLQDLFKNPAQYNGKKIFIYAEPTADHAMCTLMYCGQNNPCCNSCGASMMVKLDGQELMLKGTQDLKVGCGGNNCNWQQNCTPFTLGESYYIYGTFTIEEYTNSLTVENYCE